MGGKWRKGGGHEGTGMARVNRKMKWAATVQQAEAKDDMHPGCLGTARKTHLVSSWSLVLLQEVRGEGYGVSNPHPNTHTSLLSFSSRLSPPQPPWHYLDFSTDGRNPVGSMFKAAVGQKDVHP